MDDRQKHRVKRDEHMYQVVLRVMVMMTTLICSIVVLGFVAPYVIGEAISADELVIGVAAIAGVVVLWFDTVVSKSCALICEFCSSKSVRLRMSMSSYQSSYKCDSCGVDHHIFE